MVWFFLPSMRKEPKVATGALEAPAVIAAMHCCSLLSAP
jgi:hypothetical protein